MFVEGFELEIYSFRHPRPYVPEDRLATVIGVKRVTLLDDRPDTDFFFSHFRCKVSSRECDLLWRFVAMLTELAVCPRVFSMPSSCPRLAYYICNCTSHVPCVHGRRSHSDLQNGGQLTPRGLYQYHARAPRPVDKYARVLNRVHRVYKHSDPLSVFLHDSSRPAVAEDSGLHKRCSPLKARRITDLVNNINYCIAVL